MQPLESGVTEGWTLRVMQRLGMFGLELHHDQTHRIEFGRYAEHRRAVQKSEKDQTQWACGVGAFINSTNILLNLARSKSIWISTSCAPSFGLSLSVQVSVFP